MCRQVIYLTHNRHLCEIAKAAIPSVTIHELGQLCSFSVGANARLGVNPSVSAEMAAKPTGRLVRRSKPRDREDKG
ncbi:hypothetical protein BPNPMPFG_007257 (plasmid) [Mesorhizobium sp. AR07]|nr:hypothetical protein [Mesorhizobium sp. AR07]UVK48767.1 hypothetical protein BPNPMPFG_007257 [Mesorhizobium sp. AR07]